MKCLVTGHEGYIGSHLIKQLEEMGHETAGIDLKSGKNILHDMDDFLEFNPDVIFHLAAIPRVPYSIEHPEEVYINNVIGTLKVLEFARKSSVSRVVYSSSSSVVGNGDGPESPYAASKLAPEDLCSVYSKLYDVDTVSLRYFNVYSPDQKADGPYATAVANWMDSIETGKRPFITGTGDQRRDMAHVSDVVSANIFCMNHSDDFCGNHYDVGTGTNISLNEMKAIVHTVCPDIEFDYVPDRPGDVYMTQANMIQMASLGWNPSINIIDGIQECFSRFSE